MSWSDRHSDEFREGRHDFESRGRYGYDRELYRDYGQRGENYTAGFDEAKREEDRREERRQEEAAEQARQERMAAQRENERQQEEQQIESEQQEPEPQQEQQP